MKSEKEILLKHLGPVLETERGNEYSAYRGALNDARLVTGRSLEDGSLMPDYPCKPPIVIWLGALGYIALLDQIGACFKPSHKPRIEKGNSISKALKYFTGLSDAEIDAIYALRCSFAHDYGLSNIKKNKDKSIDTSLTHRFQVNARNDMPLVSFPTEPWDGVYTNKKPENVTKISLFLLCELVEGICAQLLALAESGNLDVELDKGYDELERRYGFYSGK